MAWYHEFNGGRSFYIELGHTEESYSDSLYLKHILGGIQYAIANSKGNHSTTKAPYPPDENPFTKTVLSLGEFFEPTEMTILPNPDVLIIQRKAEKLRYSCNTAASS